jgi:hypothetical protein
MPRLLTSAIKARKPFFGLTTNTHKNLGKKLKKWKPFNKTATYKWLNWLGFYATKEKKEVYIDSHKKANIIKYWQNEFLSKIALLQLFFTNYKKDANSVL